MRPHNKSSSPSSSRRRSPTSPGRAQTLDSTGFASSDPNTVSSPRSTSSSARARTRTAASLLDAPILVSDDLRAFDDEQEQYTGGGGGNPRSFPYSVKQQCWEKAARVKGRDPDRWRRDALGNLVFRKLVGCPGCLCHDYDHIIPYSKGGKSTLDNCQVLQATVNRSKGNRTEISKSDLAQKSAYCKVTGRDMDLLEVSAYGNVRRGQDSSGCNIQ